MKNIQTFKEFESILESKNKYKNWSRDQIQKRFDELEELAMQRMEDTDMHRLPGYSSFDMLTRDEQEELYYLKQSLPSMAQQKLDAQKRLKKRIADRKARRK